jgi:hypothetical protein
MGTKQGSVTRRILRTLSTHVLSTLSPRLSTVKRDQLVAEQVLSRGNVSRDLGVEPASLEHGLVLNPEAFAPRFVIDPALDGFLAGIETVLLYLEELGIAGVESGAVTVAAGQVGDGRTLGMRPLVTRGTLVAGPADVDHTSSLDGSDNGSAFVPGRRARNVPVRTQISYLTRTLGEVSYMVLTSL